MFNSSNGLVQIVLSGLFFPLFFQAAFLSFAWGEFDPLMVMLLKRIFLLLPVMAIILGCWVTIACLITVIFRQNRQHFIIALFVTWWDMGKSVVSFWGGILKFVFNFLVALMGLFKIILLGIWSLIQEIIFMPFRLIGNVGKNVVSSGVPWIAFFLTIFWCLLEAVIFTYVTTPLVVDTFSNITGEQLSASFVRIPLFIFLLFIVLGSYAVLSTMVEVVKNKNISAIIGIGVIETVTLFVEVVFLYREFVDSLVPWFAQYSQNFELGIFWTLAIAGFVWFGVRSLSWFLFASHGTPALMAIIQGKGLKVAGANGTSAPKILNISSEFMQKIKQDMEWIENKSEDLLASFILPPLQVVASAINFCTLLITSKHLFELPFRTINDIKKSTVLIESLSVAEKKSKKS
ncbi:MAG: hypothetical protein A2Y94_07935 [Caldithrix sp. RBG_13_44_9]|nr:MAG: hypothetical protein A2Y94_07935 [Caldithrix sp. RBG_13_44_9]